MTCSELLAVAARRGAGSLSAGARAEVGAFVLRQLNADGGFRGRAAASDLYYTHFAVQALDALGIPVPESLDGYLGGIAGRMPAKLVNLACLAVLSSRFGPDGPWENALRRIGAFRSNDGGFSEREGGGRPSAYASFLAVLAYEARGAAVPDAGRLAASLLGMSPSVTPAIAARAMLLACLGQAPAKADAARLMAVQCRSGGFMAARLAPVPDLLSTATALCALVAMGAPLEPLRDSCTSFVESLWTDSGGFGGHPADGTADCEYTYYALLSLGTLAGA